MARRAWQHTVLCITLMVSWSCATTVALVGAQAVPGARGKVQVTRGANGNTQLTLAVEHLAPAGQVASGASAYVVWVQAVDHVAPPQNVGALKVDEKDLTGSLETVTPLKEFDLTVTPETSPQIGAQAGQPIFTARIDRID